MTSANRLYCTDLHADPWPDWEYMQIVGIAVSRLILLNVLFQKHLPSKIINIIIFILVHTEVGHTSISKTLHV